MFVIVIALALINSGVYFLVYPMFVIAIALALINSDYLSIGSSTMLQGEPLTPKGFWKGDRRLAFYNSSLEDASLFMASLQWTAFYNSSLEDASLFMTSLQAESGDGGVVGVHSRVSYEHLFQPFGKGKPVALTYNATETLGASEETLGASALHAAILNAALHRAYASGDAPNVHVRAEVRALPGRSVTAQPRRSVTAQPRSWTLAFLLTLALLYPPTYIAEAVVGEREHRLRHVLAVLGARTPDYWTARLTTNAGKICPKLRHVLAVLGARTPDYWIARLIADSGLFLIPGGVALIAGAFSVSMSSASYVLSSFFTTTQAVAKYFATVPLLISTVDPAVAKYFATVLLLMTTAVAKYFATVLLLVTTVPLSLMFSASAILPHSWASVFSAVLSFFPSLALAWGLFSLSVAAILSRELERESTLADVLLPSQAPLAVGSLVLRQLALLCVSAAVTMGVTMAIDARRFRRARVHERQREGPGGQEEDARVAVEASEDIGVAAEAARIEAAGREGCGEVGSHRLRKVFGHGARATVAVKQLSFGVPRGECLCLLGPNGAGKSSTMLMLSGETAPSGGDP
ncbi:hypothetical protein T484DRAFT_1768474 [Baffinella frigidus]|nr:hypothetical protein T484DRAFT_1768474 [Cryptophyta sp. CCMP2293]